MKEGDRVKVIRTSTVCRKGCQTSVGCKFLDMEGVIYKTDYMGKDHIYVREFLPEDKAKGCSGFLETDLQIIPPIVQYLPLESIKVGDYVRLADKLSDRMSADIGALAVVRSLPYMGKNGRRLISVDWIDNDLRHRQVSGGYSLKKFEVLNMKVNKILTAVEQINLALDDLKNGEVDDIT
ncbi:hypothetical protein LCGC14_2333590, partial [marine sediment metagenome]